MSKVNSFGKWMELETLVSNLPGIVYRRRNDCYWTMEYLSKGCFKLTGYEPEEFIGNNAREWVTVIHEDDRHYVWDMVQAALSVGEHFTVVYRAVVKDGTLNRYFWEQGYGVRDDQGSLIAIEGFICDITAYKELEHKLMNARKMEALGLLSAGIAHDFNNLISPVLCYSELLLNDPSLPEHLKECVLGIQESGLRARKLSRKLVVLGKNQSVQREELSINQLVLDFNDTFSSLIGENYIMELELCSTMPRFKGDVSQMEQILLNLAVNARDAMPDGGTITIKIGEQNFGDDRFLEAEIPAGEYVTICVSDTGIGMDKSVCEKIFEPFFTTKTSEKGTGLGLFMVHGIVSQYGGCIHVYSEKGVGSNFVLYLPLCGREIALEKTKNLESSGVSVSQSERLILVLDDESHLRRLIGNILSKNNYKVLEAGSLAELKVLIQEQEPWFDLLLCDAVLTDTNCAAAYNFLQERQPQLKVIYMSGYIREMVVGQKWISPEAVFLQKPFSVHDLTEAVRLALDV